ncbi:MAG: response regulator [Oscillospiraceae bacterium]|nr:response regulator [Oscillospiraceae bacterium]
MNLLIVDDQMSVVEGLKAGINWKAMGFTRVDTAFNAIDAKACLKAQEPDIMLCDIEMPMENGLQLLAWMREQKMETRCIFLTAHAKFNYAQEAVRLGGFDYIIQPAPYWEIKQVVEKAVQDVWNGREQSELQQMGKAFYQQETAIIANVLRNFLYKQPNTRDVATLEKLGIMPMRELDGYLVMIHPLRWETTEKLDGTLLAVALGNMATEIFEPHAELSVVAYMMQEDCCALVLQSAQGEEMPLESVVRQLMFLESVLTEYMHCTVACYLDGPLEVNCMPSRWEKLIAMREDNVSLHAGVFVREEKARVPHTFRVPQIRSWYTLLKEGYTEAMEKEGCDLLDKLSENGQLDSSALRIFYQDFMQMVYHAIEGSEDKMHQMFHEPADLELYRNAMKSVDSMKQFLRHVASHFFAPAPVEDQKAVVAKVRRYIDEHLENELRRDELAEYVHLNPDYLTRIFKKETGWSLKEYVVHQKMEEAKVLLQTTTLPVSFIAAKVGYCNFSHFSFTYKKVRGVTPQEERQGTEET